MEMARCTNLSGRGRRRHQRGRRQPLAVAHVAVALEDLEEGHRHPGAAGRPRRAGSSPARELGRQVGTATARARGRAPRDARPRPRARRRAARSRARCRRWAAPRAPGRPRGGHHHAATAPVPMTGRRGWRSPTPPARTRFPRPRRAAARPSARRGSRGGAEDEAQRAEVGVRARSAPPCRGSEEVGERGSRPWPRRRPRARAAMAASTSLAAVRSAMTATSVSRATAATSVAAMNAEAPGRLNLSADVGEVAVVLGMLSTSSRVICCAHPASAPGTIRTCDRRIRSPLLCPAELRGPGRSVRRRSWCSRRGARTERPQQPPSWVRLNSPARGTGTHRP